MNQYATRSARPAVSLILTMSVFLNAAASAQVATSQPSASNPSQSIYYFNGAFIGSYDTAAVAAECAMINQTVADNAPAPAPEPTGPVRDLPWVTHCPSRLPESFKLCACVVSGVGAAGAWVGKTVCCVANVGSIVDSVASLFK